MHRDLFHSPQGSQEDRECPQGGLAGKEKAGHEARLIETSRGAAYGTELDQAEVSPDSKPSEKVTTARGSKSTLRSSNRA